MNQSCCRESSIYSSLLLKHTSYLTGTTVPAIPVPGDEGFYYYITHYVIIFLLYSCIILLYDSTAFIHALVILFPRAPDVAPVELNGGPKSRRLCSPQTRPMISLTQGAAIRVYRVLFWFAGPFLQLQVSSRAGGACGV